MALNWPLRAQGSNGQREAAFLQPRAPSLLRPHSWSAGVSPSPSRRGARRCSPAAEKEGHGEADSGRGQGLRERLPGTEQQPGSPVVSSPTCLQGAELSLNHGRESLTTPRPPAGVTLPFPHPARPAPQGPPTHSCGRPASTSHVTSRAPHPATPSKEPPSATTRA